MAILDPLFNAFATTIRLIDSISIDLPDEADDLDEPEDIIGIFADLTRSIAPLENTERSEELSQAVETGGPFAEIAAIPVDLVEEFILADLEDKGELTPDNVEGITDTTEGGAALVLGVLASAGVIIEALSLGQVDEHQEYITQILAGLGVDDVTGLELESRIENGITPALEAKVAKEHRPEFVNLQDAVEYALRNKEADFGWLKGETAPAETIDKIGSNEPVNPNNLLEEWGIRDDQLDILEQVSLEAVEIEELIESPVQFGVVPDESEYEEVLQISGLPEDTKDLFRRTIESAPRAADLWEQRTTTGDLVGELDTLVRDGEITPDEAMSRLPDEIDEARPALRDRFRLFTEIAPGRPSETDFESAFAFGYLDLDAYRERLDASEYDTEAHEGVLKASILSELDGDLQTALGLGLIGENEYSNLAGFAGLPQGVVTQLAQGGDLDKIASRRLTEEQSAAERGASLISGIGEARAFGLQSIGIETISDLAQADVADVADAAGVSDETAARWIAQAQQATQ